MGLILDTSVLVASERGRFQLERFLEDAGGDGPLGLPTIVASEFLHGVERATPGRRRDERLAFFERVLNQVEVFGFDLETARTHAELWAKMAVTGVTIGPHDLIIAATCLHLDWSLATLNEGEFSRVPNLRLVPTSPYRNSPNR